MLKKHAAESLLVLFSLIPISCSMNCCGLEIKKSNSSNNESPQNQNDADQSIDQKGEEKGSQSSSAPTVTAGNCESYFQDLPAEVKNIAFDKSTENGGGLYLARSIDNTRKCFTLVDTSAMPQTTKWTINLKPELLSTPSRAYVAFSNPDFIIAECDNEKCIQHNVFSQCEAFTGNGQGPVDTKEKCEVNVANKTFKLTTAGYSYALTQDSTGNLHAAFIASYNMWTNTGWSMEKALVYATYADGKWTKKVLDSKFEIDQPDIEITKDGTVHIAAKSTQSPVDPNTKKYVYFKKNGENWSSSTISTKGQMEGNGTLFLKNEKVSFMGCEKLSSNSPVVIVAPDVNGVWKSEASASSSGFCSSSRDQSFKPLVTAHSNAVYDKTLKQYPISELNFVFSNTSDTFWDANIDSKSNALYMASGEKGVKQIKFSICPSDGSICKTQLYDFSGFFISGFSFSLMSF